MTQHRAAREEGEERAVPGQRPAAPGGVRRIAEVDALRGFALGGILLVNVLTMSGPAGLVGGRPEGGADTAALWLVTCLAQSKFYLLFSFLFGYSFTLQSAAAARAGARVAPRTLRRLLGLLVLGVLHAVFLYIGDILTSYALLGPILLAARRAAPGKALRAALWVWGALGALMLLVGAFGYLDGEPDGASEAEAARYTAAYRGGFGDVVGANLDTLPLAAAAALFMAGFVVAAFLAGLAAGKRGWITAVGRPALRRTALAGLCVGLPFAVFSAAGTVGPLPGRWELLAGAVGIVAAPALTAAYACGLLLWLRSPRGERAGAVLASAGRLALTHYLTQSLVMALVFTGYGLGLYGKLGVAVPVGLALLLYAGQLAVSGGFLARFRTGPVERLLRGLTHLGERAGDAREVNER
ncbi:DUF418 domain-containing protein [Streptomyces sp. NPDC050504]|uniref:DUF418 domain-containing protein n=1 Tax=Streptomyces sp. NPDC050504 TaxID=3365618 RepID=UPI0037AF197C